MTFNIEELKNVSNSNKVVGTKQTLKIINKGEAKHVIIAKDAEDKVVSPLVDLCKEKEIPWSYAESMNELGKTCGIKVGASAAALIE